MFDLSLFKLKVFTLNHGDLYCHHIVFNHQPSVYFGCMTAQLRNNQGIQIECLPITQVLRIEALTDNV